MRIVATARYIDANPPGTKGNAITLGEKPQCSPQPTHSLLSEGWHEHHLSIGIPHPLRHPSALPFEKMLWTVPNSEKTQISPSISSCRQLPGVRDMLANELGMGNLATLVYTALAHETTTANEYEMGNLAKTANAALLQETKQRNHILRDNFEGTFFQEREIERPPDILPSFQIRRRDDWMNKPMREGYQ
jgi:hypothetical protein